MNEPQPGTYIDQYTFSSNYLYPFYKRVIQAITGVRDNLPDCPKHAPTGTNCSYPNLGINDKRHLFFVEPTSVRNLLDFTPQHSIPFSSYTNIVYAPHVYTHVFTIDSILHLNQSLYPPSFDYAYETALNESVGLQSAVLVTEFGCGADADERLLVPTIDSQDKAMISATIWPWKNNCFQEGCETSWSLYDSGTLNSTVANQNGPERPNRVRILSRVYPRGVIGQLKQYFYNTTTSSFIMTVNCINSTSLLLNNETIVYIPRRLNNSVINVTGEATLKKIIKNPDQSRLIIINPTCNGQYHVFVANNTNAIDELYKKTVINNNSTNVKSNNRHKTIQSMKKVYELFQLLHAAAVKTGETFVATSSNFVNKFTALQNAVEINIKHIIPLLNEFLFICSKSSIIDKISQDNNSNNTLDDIAAHGLIDYGSEANSFLLSIGVLHYPLAENLSDLPIERQQTYFNQTKDNNEELISAKVCFYTNCLKQLSAVSNVTQQLYIEPLCSRLINKP
ncbi:unnamed protein product [Rotaria sp. Silwood2]|nr:unnamed protein product [Rotaria sp. Silwood2]